MSEYRYIAALIDEWPSLTDFARDAGVTYGAAKQMKRRQSIPVLYWTALIESTTGHKIALSAERLVTAHTAATPAQAGRAA